MWILEKYEDITLKRGIANLGRSHRLPRVFNNFPSISINQCPSNTYLVLPGFLRLLYWGSYFKYRENCMSAFWSGHAGAAAGRRCLRVPLQGYAAGCRL